MSKKTIHAQAGLLILPALLVLTDFHVCFLR
jgi:hypothetical protein